MDEPKEVIRISFDHDELVFRLKAPTVREFNAKLEAMGFPSSCFVPEMDKPSPGPTEAEPGECDDQKKSTS